MLKHLQRNTDNLKCLDLLNEVKILAIHIYTTKMEFYIVDCSHRLFSTMKKLTEISLPTIKDNPQEIVELIKSLIAIYKIIKESIKKIAEIIDIITDLSNRKPSTPLQSEINNLLSMTFATLDI
ncbi:5713_t:CDS:2 [Entrophospora sp. SA101]|nr:2905_t:CDS:2 [Entrophospora sp. SA101]CAJ0646943.1 5713_t:CDS:2 [Entrophospora sp. SA101]